MIYDQARTTVVARPGGSVAVLRGNSPLDAEGKFATEAIWSKDVWNSRGRGGRLLVISLTEPDTNPGGWIYEAAAFGASASFPPQRDIRRESPDWLPGIELGKDPAARLIRWPATEDKQDFSDLVELLTWVANPAFGGAGRLIYVHSGDDDGPSTAVIASWLVRSSPNMRASDAWDTASGPVLCNSEKWHEIFMTAIKKKPS